MKPGLWWRIPFTLAALPIVVVICVAVASSKWVKEMLVETRKPRIPRELFDLDRR